MYTDKTATFHIQFLFIVVHFLRFLLTTVMFEGKGIKTDMHVGLCMKYISISYILLYIIHMNNAYALYSILRIEKNISTIRSLHNRNLRQLSVHNCLVMA